MNWCYDERYVDRKIETFKVSRRYKELIERLDVERAGNYNDIINNVVLEDKINNRINNKLFIILDK